MMKKIDDKHESAARRSGRISESRKWEIRVEHIASWAMKESAVRTNLDEKGSGSVVGQMI
jgi:hypothetical protein